MKNFFACSLLLSLVVFVAGSGYGAQKKRPARKKAARSELSSKARRSATSKGLPRDFVDSEAISPVELKEVEAITSTNKFEAEVSSFVAIFDSFTRQLAAKVVEAASPAEGVREAQKYLDARKAELKSGFEAVSCISDTKVSKEFMAQMRDHFFRDGVLIGRLMIIYGAEADIKAQYRNLLAAYLNIFEMEHPCPAQQMAAL